MPTTPQPTAQQVKLEALARAAKEKRPVEFLHGELVGVCQGLHTIEVLEQTLRWAWPDGTITRPESLRQRMRNLKFKRAKHGEVMT